MSSFQISEEIHEIARLAARFGKQWPWVEEYLHCFRPALDKPLKPARTKIILEELLSFIDNNGFAIEKHWHTLRANAIFEAVKYTAQLNKCGFRNHRYLMKVALSINQQMISKEETEQKEKEKKASDAFHRDPTAPTRIKNILEGLK